MRIFSLLLICAITLLFFSCSAGDPEQYSKDKTRNNPKDPNGENYSSSPQALVFTTILSDNFNRANSNVVGNGWAQNNSAAISGNQLSLTGVWGGSSSMSSISFTTNLPVFWRIRLKFTTVNNSHLIIYPQGNGYMNVSLDPRYSSLNINDFLSTNYNHTNGSFTFTSGTSYNVTLTKYSGTITLALTNTINPADNSTISCAMDDIVAATMLFIRGGWADSSSTHTVFVDDLILESIN